MGATVVTGPVFGDGPGGITVVITAPSGIVAGDLLLAYLHSDNDGNAAAMTAPAGWTQISSSADTVSTIGGFGKIWTKTAGGSEPGTYSFPGSGASDNTGFMWRINGHNPGSVFAASPVWANPGAGATTSLIAPSVTLSAGGLLVCGFTLEGMFGGSITPPGGMTGTSVSNSVGFVQTLPGTEAGKLRGSTGTRTATASSSGVSNLQGYLTFSLAIGDALPVPLAPAVRRVRPPIRRRRVSVVVPAQVTPAAPAKVATPSSLRRAGRFLRRPRVSTPVPAQVIVAAPARTPSAALRILARAVVARRPRSAMKPRAQALPPPAVRAAQTRRVAFGPRRGVEVAIVPTQAAPAAPAKTPAAVSPRRVARWLRRPEAFTPVPAQVFPAPDRPQSPGRARRMAAIARRGVEVAVVPPQAAPAAPAKVPSPSSARRISVARRRPQVTAVVPEQALPGRVSFTGRSRRHPALARRGVDSGPVQGQTPAPLTPPTVQGPATIRRVARWLRRPEAFTPVPVQVVPPNPIDSPRPPPRAARGRRGRAVTPLAAAPAALATPPRPVRRRLLSVLLRRGRRASGITTAGAPDFRLPKAPRSALGDRSGPSAQPGTTGSAQLSRGTTRGPAIEPGDD